ncbi:helix-turn-helix domain-containing protein [Pontixanthobacter gangjinensis]|uniref:Helix-turn-helix domain-containing protein n=1 Tax=Pontixanthobacter gangjinensis TaxID=1028742 RepID=A0A6I4SLQ4_9SPHN|nr:AraC family transcriptional regulator [Pontixanthobacter gangjinensis]MXO55747.1 helix-turn-helix domain-containing protein [Pontixanthobacter gangjinensis]
MPPRFHLEYFDPPAALQRYVLTLFSFVWDEPVISDRHPGALAQFSLFPYGSGWVEFAGKRDSLTGEAHMLAGFSSAAPFAMKGPWHAIGASLSSLGWAALTQKPANRFVDRFIPPQELIGGEVLSFAADTNEHYRSGKLSGKQAAFAVADWLAPRFGEVPELHERLIGQVTDWLGGSFNPDLEDLFSALPYSRRQAERLVERYFGFPPAALARKYRAIRAASLLAEHNLTSEEQARIEEAFYDQPHMIREIRRYCGYTPSRLGGDEEPLFQAMLRMKNFNRIG